MDGRQLVLDATEEALEGEKGIRFADQVPHLLLLLLFLLSAVDQLSGHGPGERADHESEGQKHHHE